MKPSEQSKIENQLFEEFDELRNLLSLYSTPLNR